MLGMAKHRSGGYPKYEYTVFRWQGTISDYFPGFAYLGNTGTVQGGSADAYTYTNGIQLTPGTWQVKILGTIDMAYVGTPPQLLALGPSMGADTDLDPFIDTFYYNNNESTFLLAHGVNRIRNNQVTGYYDEYANFPGSEYTITLTETTQFPLYFNLLPDGVDAIDYTATWDMTVTCRRTIL